MNYTRFFLIVGVLVLLGGLVTSALADHSWGTYHWARTASPFMLKLGDNVDGSWQSYFETTSSQWNFSSALDTAIVAGGTNGTKGRKTPKNCVPTSGRVEVCNESYGNNGWLGIAQIWVSGDHIVQGTTKVNDFYFAQAPYNTPEWRQFVMCQEVGHTLGLGHQDEGFSNPNLGSCMDYTNDPARNDGAGDNLAPNAHDYDMLEQIYAHLDSFDSYDSSTDEDSGDGPGNGNGKGNGKGKPSNVGQDIDLNNPSAWGEAVSTDAAGRTSLFRRHLGGNAELFTFVIWADGSHSHDE